MDKNVEMIRRIMLAVTRVDGAYYYFSKKLGMKENVLTLLYALDDGEQHSQKQICQDWLIPKTTLNTSVKELVKDGYVTLQPAAGTREKTIALTETGMELAERLMKRVYEAEDAAMAAALARFSPEFVEPMEYFSHCLCREFDQHVLGDEEGKEGGE